VCDSLRKKTIEDYVERLHYFEKRRKKVHTNDIANALGINPASVTEVLQKLSDEGYINYEKYSGATLTNKGRELAIETKKKHDKLMEFFILLGVDKKIAEKDACEIEHFLHSSTMDILFKFMEIVNNCKYTPYWINRLKKYVKTGKLEECPAELSKICVKYSD
jgi:DtxR family Mn-dependent transcriptional regulator